VYYVHDSGKEYKDGHIAPLLFQNVSELLIIMYLLVVTITPMCFIHFKMHLFCVKSSNLFELKSYCASYFKIDI